MAQFKYIFLGYLFTLNPYTPYPIPCPLHSTWLCLNLNGQQKYSVLLTNNQHLWLCAGLSLAFLLL